MLQGKVSEKYVRQTQSNFESPINVLSLKFSLPL
jgi:hypothetical protein